MISVTLFGIHLDFFFFYVFFFFFFFFFFFDNNNIANAKRRFNFFDSFMNRNSDD